MSPDEMRAWASLALGVAVIALLVAAVPLVPPAFAGILGIAAGYAIWLLLPPSRRRGPPKYWRGRAHWD